MAVCFYNEEYRPISECALPLTDLAIQRGVGAFESIRVYEGRPFALSLHLERLALSADGAGIAAEDILARIPLIAREWLSREENKKFDGIIKPYITGGDINDGGKFPKPRFFVVFDSDIHKISEEERQNGVELEPNRVARPYPSIKSTNYLFGFIPLSKSDRNNFETLYITPEGEITEALSSNFFMCKGGKLITAPESKVLKGVTREIILTLARENGFSVEERCPLENELAEADEAFITGSLKEVRSVVRVGKIKIGNGKPGPVAQAMHHLFIKNMERWME
ncbi:MAG: aminotransferase class IV [Synergistes sp.]|nr:aminotransferase class IV [Synergistes sp.]